MSSNSGSDSYDSEEQEELEQTIRNPDVIARYKEAGRITSNVLKELIQKCEPGASVTELCEYGDKKITEAVNKIHKKITKKGIAFPTCISPNRYVVHFSPLHSQPDVILQENDLVKIECGAHIDGYIAVLATTFVIGASVTNRVTGRRADVIQAAHYGAEATAKLIKPGNKSFKVTETVKKVAESFNCKPVEGMLSHRIERNKIDGEKSIIQNPTDEQRKTQEECEFEEFEVWTVDCLVTTGDGKARKSEAKTSIYKKSDIVYQLKMKTSRAFYSEVAKRFGDMPFNLRNFEDEKKARMGTIECCKHNVIEAFDVYQDKENEFVAQFKFTVLVLPKSTAKVTECPFDKSLYESDYSVESEEIRSLLSLATSSSAGSAKKKKKKKKGGGGGVGLSAGDDMATDESVTMES